MHTKGMHTHSMLFYWMNICYLPAKQTKFHGGMENTWSLVCLGGKLIIPNINLVLNGMQLW